MKLNIIVTSHFGAYYALVTIISRQIPINVVVAKEEPYEGYWRCRNELLSLENIKSIFNMKKIRSTIKKTNNINSSR